jgi:hypothetical protein
VTRPQLMSPVLDPRALEVKRVGAKMFFARDVQPIILEACRRQQISFDAYALRLGSNRASLVLILKGHDAVSANLLGLLRDFVAEAAGQKQVSSAA